VTKTFKQNLEYISACAFGDETMAKSISGILKVMRSKIKVTDNLLQWRH